MSQAQLRKALRAKRSALTAEQQRRSSRGLLRQLNTLRELRNARRIACYLPNDGEIDPTPLIGRLWQQDKTCYLPVISHLPGGRLWFARYTPQSRLVLNRFGIPEPDSPRRHLIRAQSLDLILMPLVGFDFKGNRLGMGGGFYDQTLAFLSQRRHRIKPHLFGLAHELQQVDTITPNPWDIPLDGVVTDNTVYYTRT